MVEHMRRTSSALTCSPPLPINPAIPHNVPPPQIALPGCPTLVASCRELKSARWRHEDLPGRSSQTSETLLRTCASTGTRESTNQMYRGHATRDPDLAPLAIPFAWCR